jgi:hypothetical protein
MKFLKRGKSKIQSESIQNFLDIEVIDALKKTNEE